MADDNSPSDVAVTEIISDNLLSSVPGMHLMRSGYGPGVWPLRERMMLASCVLDPENQQLTWASVAKRLVDFTPPNRDASWCEAKSCAKQYALLLESAEISKRKQIELNDANMMSGQGTIFPIHNTSTYLAKKMSFERVDELNWEMCHCKVRHMFLEKLKSRILNDEITDEQASELMKQWKFHEANYKSPESLRNDNGELMTMEAACEDMTSLAEQIVQSRLPFNYPASTWVPSNRKLEVSVNLGGMRQSASGLQGPGKLSSMLDAASARKLPSSLAMTKRTPIQTARRGRGRNVATRGRRPADSGRIGDTRYKASKSVENSNLPARREYLSKRQRASMDVYVEEGSNKVNESNEVNEFESDNSSDEASASTISDGDSSDIDSNSDSSSSEYASSRPSTLSTVEMLNTSIDTAMFEPEEEEKYAHQPMENELEEEFPVKIESPPSTENTPSMLVSSQVVGRNLRLKISTPSDTPGGSSDCKMGNTPIKEMCGASSSPAQDKSLNSTINVSNMSCKSTPYRESPSKWCDLARKILDISRRMCREFSSRSELGHSFTKLQSYVAQNDFPCGVEFAHEFLSLLAQFSMRSEASEAERNFVKNLYARVENYLVDVSSPCMAPFDESQLEELMDDQAISNSSPFKDASSTPDQT